jgi:N-acetylneuraminic acid mutarotase
MRKLALVALTAVLATGCFGKHAHDDAQVLQSATIPPRHEPSARSMHTAVWDGEGMLIWGGMLEDKTTPQATGGGIYYPESGKWYPLPKHRHETRYHHSAVWTGIQMIIWGGIQGNFGDRVNTGLMFDNEDDAWLDVTGEGAPVPRSGHSGIWTGDRMIVWGGENAEKQLGDGGIYDLVQDKWEPLSDVDAPKPRAFHTGVWTGKTKKMIIWGGFDEKGARNDGAIYDYAEKQWTAMTDKGAPSPRFGHTAVWTGSKMIVWGGRANDEKYLNDGAVYDPKKDKWTPLPESGLTPRELHTATWTGKEMVIFGGQDANGAQAINGIYNPKAKEWRTFRLDAKFPPRYMHSAVWDKKQLIIFGGKGSDGKFLKSKNGLIISLTPGKAPKVVAPDETVGGADE